MRSPLVGFVALLTGCVLAFGGEASIADELELAGVQTLRLDLPSTPIVVHTCDHAAAPEACPNTLAYEGRWLSTGGTRADADANAQVPVLELERTGSFAVLRAVIPLSVSGAVGLELDGLRVPDDLDLEVHTRIGDVTIYGAGGWVDVQIDAGNVTIFGARAGLEVDTGFGEIEVESPGSVELRTGEGRVELRQTGAAQAALVVTGEGDIRMEIADDADVDLHISTRGTIRVDTPQISTLTTDQFERRLGTGGIRVELRSGRGRVDLVTATP
jgi:hypothetical protein